MKIKMLALLAVVALLTIAGCESNSGSEEQVYQVEIPDSTPEAHENCDTNDSSVQSEVETSEPASSNSRSMKKDKTPASPESVQEATKRLLAAIDRATELAAKGTSDSKADPPDQK